MSGGLSEEELVRLRAYALWVEQGQPEGREREHWEHARREIERQCSKPDVEIDGHLSPSDLAPKG